MRVNRLNPVQEATYLKKSKVGKNEECTVTVSIGLIMSRHYLAEKNVAGNKNGSTTRNNERPEEG